MFARQPLFMASLLEHFQEQQKGKLCDVIGIRDSIVSKYITEVPKFCDNVARRSISVSHAACFQSSSLMSERTVSSFPPKTLFKRWKPPSARKGSSSIEARST